MFQAFFFLENNVCPVGFDIMKITDRCKNFSQIRALGDETGGCGFHRLHLAPGCSNLISAYLIGSAPSPSASRIPRR